MLASIRIGLLGVLIMAACAPSGEKQDQAKAKLEVSWGVVENIFGDGGAVSARQQWTLTNQGDQALPAQGWALYFDSMRSFRSDDAPAEVEFQHVNGSHYRIVPTTDFAPLHPGESRTFEVISNHWLVNESDAPNGLYLALEGHDAVAVDPPRVLPFDRPEQTQRAPHDNMPVQTPELRYETNQALRLLPPDQLPPVIPTPLGWERTAGNWQLRPGARISRSEELEWEANYLAQALEPLLGQLPSTVAANESADIILRVGTPSNAAVSPEAYDLRVNNDGVEIIGASTAGVFYGVQSLRSLVAGAPVRAEGDPIVIAGIQIRDAPRFGYRGQHFDVARNFHPKETVLELLDLMSIYKLNAFQFHVTDDEGWRVEIEGLPELTRLGARRGYPLDETEHMMPQFGSGPDPDNSSGSGYYSRQEYIEILRYAHRRHIEVIPEFDVPGHARAAIKAMEMRRDRLTAAGDAQGAAEFLLSDSADPSQYVSVQGWNDNVIDVCQPSSYRFIEKVVDEFIALHEEAGAPLTTMHIGGDEVPTGVWLESPSCQRLIESDSSVNDHSDIPLYFRRRFAQILKERNLVTAGWEEIGLVPAEHSSAAQQPNPEFVESGFQPYVWNSIWGFGGVENAYRLANAGYQIVICNASNLYFDMAYNKDPKEPGMDWAGLTDTRKAYEFEPLDIYNSATHDVMGNPISAADFSKATQLTAAGRQKVLGIQGQIWTEKIPDLQRLHYQTYPKLLGLAERAWAPRPEWSRQSDRGRWQQGLAVQWNIFANALGQRELKRLDNYGGGIGYRIPPPGAVIRDGMLYANVAFPGLAVRYAEGGEEPTIDSPPYSQPVAVSGEVRLKTFAGNGRASRTSIVR